jgi:hypothetical protein
MLGAGNNEIDTKDIVVDNERLSRSRSSCNQNRQVREHPSVVQIQKHAVVLPHHLIA